MKTPGYHSSDKAFTVSVSRATYARMLVAAKERGITLHRLVKLACADVLSTDPHHDPARNRATGVPEVSSTSPTNPDDLAFLDGGATRDRTAGGGFAEL